MCLIFVVPATHAIHEKATSRRRFSRDSFILIFVGNEEEYFRLCGVAWRDPKERN